MATNFTITKITKITLIKTKAIKTLIQIKKGLIKKEERRRSLTSSKHPNEKSIID